MSEVVANAEARRSAWNAIDAICKSDKPEAEKLARCLNEANLYAAVSGDDSLVPEALRAEREKMIGSIGRLTARALAVKRDKAAGMAVFDL